jgi:hypothetical protein
MSAHEISQSIRQRKQVKKKRRGNVPKAVLSSYILERNSQKFEFKFEPTFQIVVEAFLLRTGLTTFYLTVC